MANCFPRYYDTCLFLPRKCVVNNFSGSHSYGPHVGYKFNHIDLVSATGQGSSAEPSNPGPLATGEVRSVDPDTGAQKGVKPERFDLVPPESLRDLARVFGFGATKYADRNWEAGYTWSKSYAALMRHMTAWWGGEDIDPESGQSHVAHAMWHCSVLLTFMRTHPEKDDRP